MKKILSLLLAFTLLATVGCSQTKTTSPAKEAAAPKPTTLHITYVKAPLNIPSIIEKKQQLFDKEFGKDNIKIEYPEITSGAKQTEALAAGSLEFLNALGGTSAILAAANGVDVKVIGVYSRAPKAFTILAMSPDIQSAADLKGKKVAVQTGTTGDEVVQKLLGKTSADIKRFESTPLALKELESGGVQAVVADNGVVINYLKNNASNGIATVADNDSFAPEFYGIAVKKGNAELQGKLNEGIKAIKADGTYDKIYAKYFGEKK